MTTYPSIAKPSRAGYRWLSILAALNMPSCTCSIHAFFTRALRDLGWLDLDEPFANLLTQGMVIKDGAKMSKSRGNVVDPDKLVSVFGADTARVFSMFAAPPKKDLDWSEAGVEGAHRFLKRVWRLLLGLGPYAADDWKDSGCEGLNQTEQRLRRTVHETIQRVTRDIGERQHFNTALAAIMELVNALSENSGPHEGGTTGAVAPFATGAVLRLLDPFAPHMAHELWALVFQGGDLASVPWPDHDEAALVKAEVEIVVQVNGKVRGRVTVAAGAANEDVVAAAMEQERVASQLAGASVP